MENVPEKIYLQIGLQDAGETCDDFNELDTEGVSWCADKIHDDDIEYSLSDNTSLIKELQKIIIERERRIAELEAILKKE